VLPLDHLQGGAEIVKERHGLILAALRDAAVYLYVSNSCWKSSHNEARK
jgi:hypothetical protein